MKKSPLTGLGDPEPTGKKALFQPPPEATPLMSVKPEVPAPRATPATKTRRVRTTLDMTPKALSILQELQSHHRLKTGKVLPLWKAASQAIEYYGEAKGVHAHEG